jgi:Flp pilus assembly pilin Flp
MGRQLLPSLLISDVMAMETESMRQWFCRFCRDERGVVGQFIGDERGQDLIEYTLLLAFVVFTTALLASGLGQSVEGITSANNSNLAAAEAASR